MVEWSNDLNKQLDQQLDGHIAIHLIQSFAVLPSS